MASDASASTSALTAESQTVARPASVPTTSPAPSLHLASASERSVQLTSDPQKIKKKQRPRPKPSKGTQTDASASIVGLQTQPQEPNPAVLLQKMAPTASRPKSTVAPPTTAAASDPALKPRDALTAPPPRTSRSPRSSRSRDRYWSHHSARRSVSRERPWPHPPSSPLGSSVYSLWEDDPYYEDYAYESDYDSRYRGDRYREGHYFPRSRSRSLTRYSHRSRHYWRQDYGPGDHRYREHYDRHRPDCDGCLDRHQHPHRD